VSAKTTTSANESAHSQLLGIQLSSNCPAACRSCAFECGPGRSRVLSADAAVQILQGLDDNYRAYLMPFFGFTGGEPFLHLEPLKAISKYVLERFGFDITISTNCFWAKDFRKASEILAELKRCGLAHLGISMDSFHQEFVALETVKVAIRSAIHLGISCYVQCAETKNGAKLEDLQKRLNIDSKLVTWGRVPCDPIGRAAKDVPKEELLMNWNKNSFDACSMLKTWITNQEGRVTACCGSASYIVPPAGNAFEMPLSDIINQGNLDPIYNALASEGGPSMLIKLLARHGLPQYSEKSYTGPCHACGEIFQDPKATRLLKDLLEPRKLELLAARLIVRQHLYSSQGQENLFVPV
jgi:MoaA/NifB/PqqE/SkfB family radical SAM enzyme